MLYDTVIVVVEKLLIAGDTVIEIDDLAVTLGEPEMVTDGINVILNEVVTEGDELGDGIVETVTVADGLDFVLGDVE